MKFERGAIREALERAERRAINTYAEEVAKRARAKAPVRKMTHRKAGVKRAYNQKLTGMNLLARQAVRRAQAAQIAGKMTRAEFQSYRYNALYGGALKLSQQRRGATRSGIVLGREVSEKSLKTRTAGGGGRMHIANRGRNRGKVMNIPGATAKVRMAPGDRFRAARGVEGRRAKLFNARGERVDQFFPSGDFDAGLTSRGRYDIKTGRAVFTNEMGQLQAGGRLKASIQPMASIRKGRGMHGGVEATAPYAIYVEFPTRHNAAQPFLLPALKESKSQFKDILQRELRNAGLKKG